MDNPTSPCAGCTGCAMRCTDGINISDFEYQRIVEELRAADPHHVRRVLEQDKRREWFEGITYTACLFLDLDSQRCLVYAARPLVCRLFGRVRHLPCPLERFPADYDAARILDAYTRQPLRTFPQWMAHYHLFSFEALLGAEYTPPIYELPDA